MDNTKLVYTKCLSQSIRGRKIELTDEELKFNIDELINIAIAQDTVSLIYNSINTQKVINVKDKESIDKFRKQTFVRNINLLKFMSSIEAAIVKLALSGKKIIVLKGFVLRRYYPFKEARTMGDVDIIVEKKELEDVTRILNELKFKDIHQSGVHREFENDKGARIEVHWELINTIEFKTSQTFDKFIWHNLVPIKINKVIVYSLNTTDLITHICIHMAVHQKNHGFGFRQLCDLVLIIENEKKNIDWNKFKENIEQLKIEKFTYVLFRVANKVLNLEIPKQMKINFDSIKINYIDEFIKLLFIGGVHGKSSNEEKILYRTKGIIIEQYMLCDKYNYAKRNKFLLPVAIVHRLMLAIVQRKYKLREIFDYYLNGKEIRMELKELNNWLEL